MREPITPKVTPQDLREELARTTDAIVETLTARSQAVENKLDALESFLMLTLTRIEGKLDATLEPKTDIHT